MNKVIYVYLALIFFVYLIFCSILYIIAKEIYENRFDKKVKKLYRTFGSEVLKQVENIKNNKELSKIDLDYIREKLKYKTYEKAFNDMIVFLNKDKNNYQHIRKYMENFQDYIEKSIKKYKKATNIKKIYGVFLLGEYRLNNYFINEFLINSLNTDSIHLTFNILNSIAKIGNIQLFIESLKYISSKNKYINNKLFIDIIDNFNGDMYKLNKELFTNLDSFNDTIKCTIINHFENCKYADIKEELLQKLINNNTDKEVKLSIIRYFNSVKYDKAKTVLLDILKNAQWECRALSAKSLAKYYCEETYNGLLESITDKNWYVRLNSAISLLSFNVDNEKLVEVVLGKNDKYSKEILFYVMFMKNKISYEKYEEITKEQLTIKEIETIDDYHNDEKNNFYNKTLKKEREVVNK